MSDNEWFNADDVLSGGGAGKYLNAKFLKTIPRMACKVTIQSGGSREVDDRDNPGKKKIEIFLRVTSASFEGEKEMGLNKTNLTTLLDGLGKKSNSWAGREIGVFFDPTVKFGPDVVGGMKVKVFEADPFAAPLPVAAAAAAPTVTTTAIEDAPF